MKPSDPSNVLLNVSVRGLIEHLSQCGVIVSLHPQLGPKWTQPEELEARLSDALQPVARILLPQDSDVVVTHGRTLDTTQELYGGDLRKAVQKPAYDPMKGQVGGSHYKGMKIQHAEFCQANRIPWCESAAIKYLCRHAEKNKVQDVDKAIHYALMLRKLDYPDAPPFQLPGQ